MKPRIIRGFFFIVALVLSCYRKFMNKILLLRLSFLTALMATLGSLYFGEVLKYPPCTLCWYQRICMYPLVIIFGAALWTEDEKFLKNSLPLTLIGLIIAGYHNLLYYKIIPENLAPCVQGVSCTTKYIELLGFLTIPLMSGISFALITAFNFIQLFATRNSNETK